MEIFSLQESDEHLACLANHDGVHVWSAGAAHTSMPDGFEQCESFLLVARGTVVLDASTTLVGPALAWLGPGTRLVPEIVRSPFRALYIGLATTSTSARRRYLQIFDAEALAFPRTLTATDAILHWLPRTRTPERRTWVGAPTLVLNLGHASLPLVADSALVALPPGSGATTSTLVNLQLPPGHGPVLGLELLRGAE